MSAPYNDDTRSSYVERHKATHLAVAKAHHDLGSKIPMWQQLFTWAQAEDIYGAHWDKLNEKNT